MALAYPLTEAQFMEKLPVASARVWIDEPRQNDRMANGTILPSSIGDPVWRGTITLTPHQITDAKAYEIEALLSLLDRAGSSFVAYDTRRAYPAYDPDGTIVDSYSPIITQLAANNREMSIGGLPVGYTITPGDMLSFTYGANPVRRALHRAVTGATVGAGESETGLFEVQPPIKSGALTGSSVRLKKPIMKAILEPGPDYGGGRPAVVPGASFSFVQTLR
jgi:hypothetical protein